VNPLISIIIPTYNRAHLIGETLNSVLGQTYEKWECVVVDDRSSDDSEAVIKKISSCDNRIKYFKRPVNRIKGANACRNFGFEKSGGQFIIFLDSDDLLDSECLQLRMEMMKNNPNLDFIVFSMGIFTSIDNPLIDNNRKVFYFENNEKYLDQFLKGPLPWNMTRPIYRRFFFEKTHGFDEKLMLFQDDEFHIRVLFLMSPNFIIVDVTDCYYRIGSHQEVKYNNKEFRALLISQYFQLRLKHLNLFQGNLTQSIKKSLVQSFISISRNYSDTRVQFKILTQLLLLYKNEKIISLKQEISIWLILLINTFYKNKPGFHSVNKKLIRLAAL
jgi:glycosyltransferase involved in cell wall biosynthesis